MRKSGGGGRNPNSGGGGTGRGGNNGNRRWGGNSGSGSNNDNKRGSGKSGSNGRRGGAGVCFNFQKGNCSYGSKCKFLHSGQSNVKTGDNRSNFQDTSQRRGGAPSTANDSNRLIKQLKNTQQNDLADVIKNSGPLWRQCWGDAASQMSVGAVELLVQTLAKVPFSQEAKVPPPPIHALSSAMKRYLTSNATDPLLAAETALNVVRKMLSFEWSETRQVVKESLSKMLEDAANKLQRRNKDHRDCMNRIDECLDKLEKPWIIKETHQGGASTKNNEEDFYAIDSFEPDGTPSHHHSNWRNATIGWLAHSPTFSPTELPKMQGPATKSRGVYKNREHYFDTMQRLMTAMAFSEGHSAVSPACWERGSGGQSCGGALVRLPDESSNSKSNAAPLKCRGRGCSNPPVFACKIASHSRGLCQRCVSGEMNQLLGPLGSTHVYNGSVGRIDGASGKLYIQNFSSRKAQMDENWKPRPIHWRSTKRLSIPNLVGIVRLGDASTVPMHCIHDPKFFRSLHLQDRIHWAEVCPHGNQQYEDKQRQQGNICVNLASAAIFEPDKAPDVEHEFSEGDIVVIIDCMSFVPEYMPVIRAYEQQQNEILPFDNGVMLNIDASKPVDLTNTVLGADAQNKAAAEGDFQKCIVDKFGYGSLISNDSSLADEEEDLSEGSVSGNSKKAAPNTISTLPRCLIEKLIDDMLLSSTILPLREIRNNQSLSQLMQTELVDLLVKATLDFGQLVNFVDSLRNPVHCTQGPPGTGKSYLGVQLVYGLTIIRKYWMQVNKSVGTPPILVLSYKNHATDEFLSDLLKVMGPSLSGNRRYNGSNQNIQMVRMGNPGDPSLTQYSERNLAQQRGDKDVQTNQKQVHELQYLRRACHRAQRSATLFQSYQSDVFDTTSVTLGVEELGSDDIRKRQNNAAYEATEVLFAAIVRRHLLFKFASDQKLDNISSVMNRDAQDDNKFTCTQQHGRLIQDEIEQLLAMLYKGIQHYILLDASCGDPYELLYMFLSGQHPKPSCKYKESDQTGKISYRCEQIAEWHDVPLCRGHRCVLGTGKDNRCSKTIHPSSSGMLCEEHMCWSEGCGQPRIRIGEEFPDESGVCRPVQEKHCNGHSCFVCVASKISPAMEAWDDPPRNVCENHPLCSVMDCFCLALKSEDYCEKHMWKRCEYQDETTSERCQAWAISSDMPCCYNHKSAWFGKNSRLNESVTETDTFDLDHAAALKLNSQKRNCLGTNRKKKPCGGFAMVGSDFCEAHAPKDAGFKAKQAEREAEIRKVEKEEVEAKARNKMDVGVLNAQADVDSSSQSSTSEINDDLSYGPPPDLDNIDLARCDNLDEAEEGDGVQHIREVFEIYSGDEEDDDDNKFEDALEDLNVDDSHAKTQLRAPIKDSKEWSWSLSLDDRWAACQAFMNEQCGELSMIMNKVKEDLPQARKRLREAESRARAKVFENKTVIGGTIVGCITRLEAIRSTRPFAVIVEEASEVLEPLLFACLCQSTVKLQLIGDHLQLQPSLMDKYEFMRVNQVGVSMFERLICAPDDHRVPSGVLSVQRRMRRDVCDLTRDYYTDIVKIEDHPVCLTKTLPGQEANSSFWGGREVPGVRSHLFLWTHSGAQGRADVGVSKCNKIEAQMCVNLAYYLVKCGVSKPSIAVLTPYKGQLMLIRKLLLCDQSNSALLTKDHLNQNQVRLSTVDRFQGDEADIVIASLVVDEKSRTQFVKLQNRMIVLLSRARLGCFVLGNIGYFKQAGGAKHWMKTFAILEAPPATSDNSADTLITVNTSALPRSNSSDDSLLPTTRQIALTNARFTEARVGTALPLCCPQHPLISSFDATNAKDLDLGFCQIACDKELVCSHTCGLKCHWAKRLQHNKKCKVLVDSPCSKHPEGLQCIEVYKHTATSKLNPINDALDHYQCPKKGSVMLPCSHEEEMPCWQEDKIAQGKAQYPKCHKPSPVPYVHSDCGHKIELTCAKLEQYSNNKSIVKPCVELVEYRPTNCTHVKNIKCYLDTEYRAGKRAFICSEKLTVILPRCGHEVRNMSCNEHVDLEKWSGCAADDVGIVMEGVARYGSKDYTCRKPSKFVRICGHEEATTCNNAFEMAEMIDLDEQKPCFVRVPIIHPHCGHPCDVACIDVKKVDAVEKLTTVPINEVHQGLSKFPDNLPRGIGRCTELVTLHRNCGHSHQLACGAVRGTQTRCKKEVTIQSPLCGHNISVPCWRRKVIEAWRPWGEDTLKSLLSCSTLLSDAKPAEGFSWPDTDSLSILKGCSNHTTVSKSCGHTYKECCSELLSILHNGGKTKRGSSCTETVTRELPNCGHEVTVICKTWQLFTDKKTTIRCGATVERRCWNASKCGSVSLTLSCTDTNRDNSTVCCPRRLEWKCNRGEHTNMLQLCMNGVPSICHQCQNDDVTKFIDSVKEKTNIFPLPHLFADNSNNREHQQLANMLSAAAGWHHQDSVKQCVQNLNCKSALDPEAQKSRFFSALAQNLGKFQSFTKGTSTLAPVFIPIFFVLDGKKKKQDAQKDGFIRIKNFVRPTTLNGIAVHHMTRENLLSLANESKGSTKKSLLCGYLFSSCPKFNCDMPIGKKKRDASVQIWREVEGHDCVEFNPKSGKLTTQIIVWDPAALYATHRVGPLGENEIREFAEDVGAALGSVQGIQSPSHTRSGTGQPENIVVGEIADNNSIEYLPISSVSHSEGEMKKEQLAATSVLSLQGSWAELIRFALFSPPPDDDLSLCLRSYSSQTNQDVITESVEQDIMKKLSLVNSNNDNPFGGKKFLERGIKDHKKKNNAVYQLLLALEIHAKGDVDRAMIELQRYCTMLQEAVSSSPTGAEIAHPLLLLAFARIGFPDMPVSRAKAARTTIDKTNILCDFARCAPGMISLLLHDEETKRIDQITRKPLILLAEDDDSNKIASPADLWDDLKDTSRIKSEAMEDLLKMTGLRRVKQTAILLFKQGLMLARMDAESRNLNLPSLNYVFLGNPGTGKTTVARLFANILHDSGLRQNDNFEETSGQELKDAGIDEFKKKAKAAMDGVLFMDEAYTLDPVGDKFKGAPVANELLNLAENERERLSFILAGYEDEINDKMFAFNPGFRSRFIEVHFDDFDEDELLRVWNGQREKRLWRESDDRLGRVVIRRLAKLKGRKGFGNARLVRQKLDEACSRAMARDDFDSLDLELRMEDAVGENPVHNEKLKAAVAEIEVKTGWRSVKKMVRKLVHVCGQNYERELQGQEQLPVLLNRLFLGNPGTGKTTCARLYGKVLKQLGFLSNGEVVEKTAGDLGGSVIGESKQKTIALIESCRGKILMIDEAYGLNDNFYGKQAIDAIVERVQGTEADDIAVLLLGYEEQMLEMFDKQNPGLRRRFAPDQAFVFEDYTNSQLEKILSDCCKAKKYNPTLEFREKALKKLDMQRRSESNFGNAGSVHNLLKGAVSQATSNRKCSLDGSLKLESEDIELPGDDTEVDLFVELDHLYSMEGVINELKKMKSQFDLADEEGEERPQLGHFVFSGAPGTGKTTVARSLGKILHRCGHIARPEIYETSGLKLTGEYVGSTKKVVEEALNKAKGGVLFIDEAYELGKGSFGSEACASLVEAMTNDDKYGGLVIVMAGYQADMQSMLDTNQGLKSRFKRFFDFPDWSSSDCTELFQSEASRNKFSIEDIEQSMEIIEKGFKRLLPLKGWGNARDVTKLYESVKENRAQRFSEEQASGSGGSSLEKIFMKKDIAMAMETLINARMGASGAPRKAGANVDPFAELNKLYRMEEVKEKLQQLQNTYVVANQDGEDIPPIGHFIFTGSPGTGKTSVARVMSDILYELELTTRRNVEETSGLKLQGQYIGETKKIVENYLDKAKGGVLFIDEAYTLGKGIYGSEARDTLVQAMTNHSMPV